MLTENGHLKIKTIRKNLNVIFSEREFRIKFQSRYRHNLSVKLIQIKTIGTFSPTCAGMGRGGGGRGGGNRLAVSNILM